MRKSFAVLLIIALVFSLMACQQAEEPAPPPPEDPNGTEDPVDEPDPLFNAGTYSATVMSMRGDLTVSVTVGDDAISSVEVVEHMDTPVIADVAIDQVPKAIVEHQSLSVDTVAGATLTSFAIISATTEALREAGADVSALRVPVEKPAITQGDDVTYDVVIVGAGGAGMNAAIEIRRDSDLSVLVIEKLAYTGGSTRVAGGAMWMTDTYRNEEAEINFTAQDLIDFMEWRSDMELNRPYLTSIAEISGSYAGYLLDQGIPFNPDRHSVGHADSNLFTLSPVNTGTGYGGGVLMDFFTDLALDLGVDIRLNTKATDLIMDNGAVSGIKAEDLEHTYNIFADKVILATGGFTRNEELIAEFAPEYTNNIPFTGAGSDGDGITMTRDLNIPIVGTDMMNLRGMNPSVGYYGNIGGLVNQPGILLNKEGERFTNERIFYSEMGIQINRQTDKTVYGIVDGQSTRIDDLEIALERGWVYKADTLEELADQLDINKDAFLNSMEDYLAVKQAGDDDPVFGVPNDRMVEIVEAPFYAIPIRPLHIGSIPGLLVNEHAQVLNADREVIENLYAAGELTFGNTFSRYYPASGTGVGIAVHTGAIAGRHAKESILDR